MNKGIYKVLFICSGNSGRSVMAEAMLAQLGGAQFEVHSAGTHPTGRVNPLALEELSRRGYSTADLGSKSWNDFARPGSPALDLVVTVCELAARETPPVWPGNPVTVLWRFPAPGAVQGSIGEVRAVFSSVCQQVEEAVKQLLRLPFERLDRSALTGQLNDVVLASPTAHAQVQPAIRSPL